MIVNDDCIGKGVLPMRRTRHRRHMRTAAALLGVLAAMVARPADAGEYYLRAGLGISHPAEAAFTDGDCSSESPAALYGCGLGGDGAPYRSRGAFGTVAALEAGLGYAVSSSARLEVVIDYRPGFEFDGRANFLDPGRRQSVAADVSSLSGTMAAYIDRPGPVLRKVGALGFFVGAGVGIAHNRIGETRMMFPATTTIVPGGNRNGFAWMVTAGVGMPLRERTRLELLWRYSDLGEVRTGRGQGRVVWRDGRRAPLLLDLAETQADLRSHELRFSLRYAF